MKVIRPQQLKKSILTQYPALATISPIVLLLIGIIAIVFGVYLVRLNSSQKPTLVETDPYLHVVSFSPQGKTTFPSTISITFSEPVDPHLVSHFFLISPPIQGHFEGTELPTRVQFIPDRPFERGVKYTFQLGLGLKSTNGKLLQADFRGGFETELATNQIQFVSDDLTGRVFTFSSNKTNEVRIKKGAEIGPITITVYNSTPTQFMAYLAYKKETKIEYNYPQINKTYFSDSIAHASFQIVEKKNLESSEGTIQIPNAVGIYYIEAYASDNKPVGSTYAVVNKTGLLFRQDDQNITLGAFDIQSGAHINDPITVKLYSAENELITRKTIELKDLSESVYAFNQPLDFIFATYNDENIFVPVNLPQSQADIKVDENLSSVYKTFLYTDRPIYKPGDTVQFRGVVRIDNDALYTLPPEGTPVKISFRLDNPERILETTALTQKSGIFWGFLTIPSDYSPRNEWSRTVFMYATVDGKYRSGNGFGDAYFDVITYTKPTFDIKTSVEKKEYLKQDTIQFELEAMGFDKQPLADQVISYQLYEDTIYPVEKATYNSSFNVAQRSFGMCGGGFSPFEEYYGSIIEDNNAITTDQNGKAVITYSLKNRTLDTSKKLTLLAYKNDSAGNKIVSAISTIVYASNQHIFLASSPSMYAIGDTLSTTFHVESLTGERIPNQTIKATLQDFNRTNEQAKTYVEQLIVTDITGKGDIAFTIPEMPTDRSYRLQLTGTDSNGNTSTISKNVTIIEAKKPLNFWERNNLAPVFLKMKADNSSYTVGETITITTTSPQDLNVLMTLERGRIYQPRIIKIPKGTSTISIPVINELSPSITAVFSFFANGEYHSEGLVLTVPSMHKLINVAVTSDKQTYRPGETAQLTIRTTDRSGNAVPANVSLAVVDKAIFALRKNATPPIHSTFYAFRPRKTNSSSSLTNVGKYNWGGRGGGGGGGGLDGKNLDTLYWNPSLVTDSSGVVTVTVPLSSQITTWKALVYGTTDSTQAGQGEVDFAAIPEPSN